MPIDRQVQPRRRGVFVPGMAALLLSALVLSGCGKDAKDVTAGDGSSTSGPAATEPATSDPGPVGSAPTTDDLEGRTFVSGQVEGHSLVADSSLTVSFEAGNMAINSGCNTQTGAFAVTDGVLAWSGTPAATMMACEDELMAQDTWVAEVFTKGLKAELDGGDLTLSSDGLTVVLSEESDVAVVGTAWTLESTVTADAAASLPAGVKAPTLEIAEDGTVTLFAGCNTGGGSATVEDGSITFSPMRLTMMACEADATAVETAVTAVLEGQVALAVDGKVMTLTKGGQSLVFRAP